MSNTWAIYDGKRITMRANQVGVSANAPEWAQQEWKVTLRHNGKRMAFPYYGGGAASDPVASDVVESLSLDSYALEVSFDEWCADYGYDTDSRNAERTYRACRKLGERFRKFVS